MISVDWVVSTSVWDSDRMIYLGDCREVWGGAPQSFLTYLSNFGDTILSYRMLYRDGGWTLIAFKRETSESLG